MICLLDNAKALRCGMIRLHGKLESSNHVEYSREKNPIENPIGSLRQQTHRETSSQ